MADKHHVSNQAARVIASPDRLFPLLCLGGVVGLLLVILSMVN